jgi:hypothetical protein
MYEFEATVMATDYLEVQFLISEGLSKEMAVDVYLDKLKTSNSLLSGVQYNVIVFILVILKILRLAARFGNFSHVDQEWFQTGQRVGVLFG